jgi:hypothetical protein
MSKFKIGDEVYTVKGCRIKGPSSGVVVKVDQKWSIYPAVVVKKYSDGKKRLFLEKNLRLLKEKGD